MHQPEAIIRPRKISSRRRRDGLIRYALDKTSQNGEDGILDRIFHLIPPKQDIIKNDDQHGYHRICVDVGAWDGVHLSNTYSLLVNENHWMGILIEADVDKFTDLSSLYANTNNILINTTISVSDPQSSSNSLHAILMKQEIFDDDPNQSNDIDFLCIDIDGNDYYVLSDLFHFSPFRPIVICIEFNPTMPDDLIYIPPRDDHQRHGASLSALVELAMSFEYLLVETTLFNAFFVRKVEYEMYLINEVPDTSIEALHENTMGTSLYQLYDGTLKLWGCKRMLWHRLPLDEMKLQMLPREERLFPFAPMTTNNDLDPFDMTEVVDMSSYCLSDGDMNCASKLYHQLQKDGFCFIQGTGIPKHLCQQALQETNLFLQCVDENVRRSCFATDRARRGYSPMNVENFASLLGEKGMNDLVRKFRIGPLNDSIHDTALLQPNVWPSKEIWDDADIFRTNIEEYYKAACTAAAGIVRAICDGLLLHHPELVTALHPIQTVSSDSTKQTTSILTLLGYRTGTRHKGKNKGPLVAAHTDVGVITMLLYDGFKTCASLQRSDGQGGWIDVNLPTNIPENPIFVINVADCLSEICNGIIPSTLHRVVAQPESNTVRNCCALFVGLDSSTELFIQNERLTYEVWRKRRIAKAQSVLK